MTTKEQMKAIIKQYADKGKKMYRETVDSRGLLYNAGFWDGYECCAKGLLRELEDVQEEPVSGLDNGNMPIERWKQAVEAASNQRNYRSSKGLTETRDDYFVDGVQWADEHPKEEPVSEDFKIALEKKVREAQDWTYIEEEGGECPLNEEFGADDLEDFAKWGANWQKEQFEKNYTDLCNGIVTAKGLAVAMAYDKGMADAKEQMIKDAISAKVTEIYYPTDSCLEIEATLPEGRFKDGDKVLIIKED